MAKPATFFRFAVRRPHLALWIAATVLVQRPEVAKGIYYAELRRLRGQFDAAAASGRSIEGQSSCNPPWHDLFVDEFSLSGPGNQDSSIRTMSVVVPIHLPDIGMFEAMLRSLLAQNNQGIGVEVVLVADGNDSANIVFESPLFRSLVSSVEPFQQGVIGRGEDSDRRFSDSDIRLIVLEEQSGIWMATNAGLHRAKGSGTLLLDQDDELHPDAIRLCAQTLSEVDAAYSDHCTIDDGGDVIEIFRKPEWSPILARTVMYTGHVKAFRTSVIRRAYDSSNFEGVAENIALLRIDQEGGSIRRIPAVLAAWRSHSKSVGGSHWAKPAVAGEFARGVNAVIQAGPTFVRARTESHVLEIVPQTSSRPSVSVIVATAWKERMALRLMRELLKASGVDIELVLIDTNPRETPQSLGRLEQQMSDSDSIKAFRTVVWNERFNYSAVQNLGAAEASFDRLLFVNDDVYPLAHDWIQRMVGVQDWSGAAIVGARLLYPDGRVQHGGVSINRKHIADHMYRNSTLGSGRCFGSMHWTREVSAVTAACLMTTSMNFRAVGGFDERYEIHYQDVDFCLKTRKAGGAVIQVQDVDVIHQESATRGGAYSLEDRTRIAEAIAKYWTGEYDPYTIRSMNDDTDSIT
jgi:GT2 family glycosyltransferase